LRETQYHFLTNIKY